MTYTLGDVDWRRFANSYFALDGMLPFAGDDETLTYAEWYASLTEEDVWIEELLDISDLEEEYTAVVFGSPENMSEEAQKICKSIHWNDAQSDVNRLTELGVEPIARVKVSLLYMCDLAFERYIVFDGESETISFTLVGDTVGKPDGVVKAIFSDGVRYEDIGFDGGDSYVNALAEKHGGDFAVILEDAEQGVKFRSNETVLSVEEYLKEN